MNGLEWLRKGGADLPQPEYRELAEVAYKQHMALMERHQYLHARSQRCIDSNTCRAIAALAEFRKKQEM